MKEFLIESFLEIGIKLTDSQADSFLRYYELLVRYDKANLTTITAFEDVAIKHFIDSVSIVLLKDSLDLNECNTLIDIGTGAGFPGIPLKILFPNMEVTLLDSLKKRIDFLELGIRELGLKNIEAIHGRAEDYAKENREVFDVAVSRAVADFRIVAELAMPFVRVNGNVVIYRGIDKVDYNENNGLMEYLGGEIGDVKEFAIGENGYRRTLVRINKIKETALKVPRKAGMAFKRALKLL